MSLPSILDVAQRAGLSPRPAGTNGEYLVRCPRWDRHQNGDAHPSCRLNHEKSVFRCDPCGWGGGVMEFAQVLGVSVSGNGTKTRLKKQLSQPSLISIGPLTEKTRCYFADILGKDYPREVWERFGASEGIVGNEPAVGFRLSSGGWKVCLYKKPDPKSGKPYTFLFCNGGGGDLLLVGNGNVVLLCAGEWDAMAALAAGVPRVATTTTGEGSWKKEWSELLRGLLVITAYDVDPAGRKGVKKVLAGLHLIARHEADLRLPLSGDPEGDGKDLSDFLKVFGKEELHALIGAIILAAPAIQHEAQDPEDNLTSFERLSKLLDEPTPADDQAKLSIFKNIIPLLRDCSPLERDVAMRRIKDKHKVGIGALRQELASADVARTDDSVEEEPPEPTEEQEALLRDPDLLGRFERDVRALGLVGEKKNAILVLLVMVSARMDDPLSLASKGESSAGKNFLIKVVCKLVPPSWIVDASSLSPQALAYWHGDLKHKVLIIAEVVGAQRADYQIRIMQSEGELIVYYVTKVDGQLQTVEKRVAGPTAMITTTTRSNLHPENETRLLEISPDESEEQTREIHRSQASRKASSSDEVVVAQIREMWSGALAALKPARVKIPFARLIEFPTKQVRSRRDFPKLLALVEALAFLHQHQRERDPENDNVIIASVADYAVAYELVGTFIRQLNTGMNQTMVQVYALLETEPGRRWKASEVATHFGWSAESGPRKAKRALEKLVDIGLVDSDDVSRGKAAHYWLREGAEAKAGTGITPPEELARRWDDAGGHLDIAWTRWMSRSKGKEGK